MNENFNEICNLKYKKNKKPVAFFQYMKKVKDEKYFSNYCVFSEFSSSGRI